MADTERLKRLEAEARTALEEALALLSEGALRTANHKAARGQRIKDKGGEA